MRSIRYNNDNIRQLSDSEFLVARIRELYLTLGFVYNARLAGEATKKVAPDRCDLRCHKGDGKTAMFIYKRLETLACTVHLSVRKYAFVLYNRG